MPLEAIPQAEPRAGAAQADPGPREPAQAPYSGPGQGLSTLDRIRARYRAFHARPTHVDLAVPGQPDLGVRYGAPEDAAEMLRRSSGGVAGDLDLLVEACECLLVRDGEGAEWRSLTEHGQPLGFELAAARQLGLDVPEDGEALDVVRAVFSTAPMAEGPASVHVTGFLAWIGNPPALDEDAALGESSPSPR
jgi:hypothetical protein